MSGITNPAEEYFKDGLWGYVTNAWKKLVATAGGALHIQFAGQEAAVEVTQTAAADLTPGVCGWDGSAWRKLPLVWGYSDRWYESLSGVKVGDGTYQGDSTPVPAGYVYVCEVFSIANFSRDPAVVSLLLCTSAAERGIKRVTTPGQYNSVTVQGPFTLKQGDYVRGEVESCINGDNLEGVAWGYKMKIAE